MTDSNPRLVQCPSCPKVVQVSASGEVLSHLSGHPLKRCKGSRVNTTGWDEVNTAKGLVLVAPDS